MLREETVADKGGSMLAEKEITVAKLNAQEFIMEKAKEIAEPAESVPETPAPEEQDI